MENILERKCHCNGSRGTDCDWCQGTGLITNSFIIEKFHGKAAIKEEKTDFIRKEFNVVNGKATEVEINNTPTKEYLEDRLLRLVELVKNAGQFPVNNLIYIKIFIDCVNEEYLKIRAKGYLNKIIKQERKLALFIKDYFSQKYEALIQTTSKNIICLECRYCKSDGHKLFCGAFPDKIPDDILKGKSGHSKILPNQKRKIIFLKKKSKKINK